MDPIIKLKQLALVAGDILTLYASLMAMLIMRYGDLPAQKTTVAFSHFLPFSVVFAVWLLIFYIGGLYDPRLLKNNINFAKQFGTVLAMASLIAVMLFYLFMPSFIITPRANLFIYIAIFGVLGYIWRAAYNNLLSSGTPPNTILLVGYNKTAQELAEQISQNPQLGYEIKFWMKEGLQDKELEHLAQIIIANKINTIVVPAHIKKDSKAAKLIYKNLVLGIEVMDLADLYEIVFNKVPLAELEEVWFLENLAKKHRIYEFFKRPVEIVLALILGILTLPLALLIPIFIKIVSHGPVIFKQERTGKNSSVFTIYKFRTMQLDAEKDGPKWADLQDHRVIPLGNLLRKTHLDELPQIINLLRGDISLVGPRPERPEFINQLRQDIPYYDLRHLIRPGITGWAQINYRYGSSIEDAYEKLQYDIYYLKNRSLWLDIITVIKTLRLLFIQLR